MQMESSIHRVSPDIYDPRDLPKVLRKKPIKVECGFCGMCDSNIHHKWVLDEKKPLYELRHLADVGILSFSQVEILIDALEKGILNHYWLDQEKSKKPNFWYRLTSLFPKK